MVVLRQRKHWGEDMYDVIDVHGGHSGLPVWMTEPRWRELRIASRPRVTREVLHSIRGLLNMLNSGSNGSKKLSFDGGSDEGSEAMRAITAPEGLREEDQGRETGGAGEIAGGTADPGAEE